MGTDTGHSELAGPHEGTWTVSAPFCPPWLKAEYWEMVGYSWAAAPTTVKSASFPPTPQGAKFAWESAGSGLEVCPEDIYGTQEIHINGAVVLAFQLYYHTTQVRRQHAHQV